MFWDSATVNPQPGRNTSPASSPKVRHNSRVSVKFYLVAAFFVVFDLEAVFLFLWAVAGRELGWPGYVETLIFVGILLAAFIYLLRTGALDWYRTAGEKERS